MAGCRVRHTVRAVPKRAGTRRSWCPVFVSLPRLAVQAGCASGAAQRCSLSRTGRILHDPGHGDGFPTFPGTASVHEAEQAVQSPVWQATCSSKGGRELTAVSAASQSFSIRSVMRGSCWTCIQISTDVWVVSSATGGANSSTGEIEPTTGGAESSTAVVEHRQFTKPVVSVMYARGNC